MTKIQWTDRTWNPVRGCSRVSEGCRNCYAERMARRFSGGGFDSTAPFHAFADDRGWTGRVELVESKLMEPLRWRKPSRVFVNSMSDLFHESLPDEAIDRVFAVMALAPQHTFQVLTKRPRRMLEWSTRPTAINVDGEERTGARDAVALSAGGMCGWPHGVLDGRAVLHVRRGWPLPNVWLGVSVEDQATADERIPKLLATPAAVRFVSYEPALGPVDFNKRELLCKTWRRGITIGTYLDWIIVGGESGPGARPFDVAWARSVVRQCKDAGVACFVKQLGANPVGGELDCDECDGSGRYLIDGKPLRCICADGRVLRDRKGGEPSEWPDDLRVREFPDALLGRRASGNLSCAAGFVLLSCRLVENESHAELEGAVG